MVKRLPTMWETRVQSLGRKDLLEKEKATHSSILAWKIPWTKEPIRLQSMGSQRVGHDWATSLHLCLHILMKLPVSPKTWALHDMGGFIRKLNKLVCFPFVNLSFASQGPSQREPRRLEGKDIFPSPTHTKQNVLDSSIIGRQLKYALYDNLYPEIMSSKLLNVSLPDTILLKCHPL